MRQLPVDFVKLDGEFVRNIVSDDRDRAFVKAFSVLAKELKIHTIGEFVESEATQNMLAEMGIDYCQGYHVGRPAPDLRLPPPAPRPNFEAAYT